MNWIIFSNSYFKYENIIIKAGMRNPIFIDIKIQNNKSNDIFIFSIDLLKLSLSDSIINVSKMHFSSPFKIWISKYNCV